MTLRRNRTSGGIQVDNLQHGPTGTTAFRVQEVRRTVLLPLDTVNSDGVILHVAHPSMMPCVRF